MFAPVFARIQNRVLSVPVSQSVRTFSTAAPAVANSVSGVPHAEPVQSSCFGQFTKADTQEPVLDLYPMAPISSDREMSTNDSQLPAGIVVPLVASAYQQASWPVLKVTCFAGPLPCVVLATRFDPHEVSVA